MQTAAVWADRQAEAHCGGRAAGTASAAKMALLPMGSSTSKFSTTLRISGGNGMPQSVAVNYTPCSLVTVSATGSPKNPAPPAPPSPPMSPPVPNPPRAPPLSPFHPPQALFACTLLTWADQPGIP